MGARAVKQRVRTWYWCGVFGELYGSASESRFAKDLVEVLAWIDGSPEEPSTVRDTSVRASRVRELRSRNQSAAYKGVNALLMRSGAADFRSGQDYDHAVFSTRASTYITSFRATGARAESTSQCLRLDRQ